MDYHVGITALKQFDREALEVGGEKFEILQILLPRP
jgi:hypothetical protein